MKGIHDRLARLERTADGGDRPGVVILIPHNNRGPMASPSETWPVVIYDPDEPPPEVARGQRRLADGTRPPGGD